MVDLLRSIPTSVHMVATIIFVAGLIVWMFGRKIMRPALILTALAMGASVGFVVAAMLPESIAIWWPIIITSLVFGLMSLATYRFVMAGLLAISLGIATPLGYFTYAELSGHFTTNSDASAENNEPMLPDLPGLGDGKVQQAGQEQLKKISDELDRRADDLLSSGDDEKSRSGEIGTENTDETNKWRSMFAGYVKNLSKAAATNWQNAPSSQKLFSILTACVGVILGLVLGLMIPNFSGAIVTSLAGSLVMLSSGSWLIARFGMSIKTIGLTSATGALSWWLGLSIIGLLIQFKFNKNKADKT